ncbi:hypothetical protein F511_45995 [Dorcoceras hygrometricum]|uniref:Uncharacterized protein n=1 Tax=Dorcoceras hygrometricum TaxID=472368 RepID=A0A2Z6ZVS1_9LAMI|nr:hypothetical protein F511_45995 [Dorcoceras hygrometricum]
MGPTSHIGPKTSRAARDRPEPNPRRNQPSRHRRSGGATRNFARRPRATSRQARRTAARKERRMSLDQRQRTAIDHNSQQWHQASPIVGQRASNGAKRRATSGGATVRDNSREAASDQRAGQQRLSCAAASIITRPASFARGGMPPAIVALLARPALDHRAQRRPTSRNQHARRAMRRAHMRAAGRGGRRTWRRPAADLQKFDF